jgi:hypothetical protein
MSKTHPFILGGKPLPLDLHTVWADDDGQPLSVGDGPINFDFRFRDVPFAGCTEESGGRVGLKLVGDVGPLPYTAESPAARTGLVRIVEAANEAIGDAFRIHQGRVLLGIERGIPAPLTATGLVTAVATFLLPAAPYLELIAIYIRPPLAAARKGESAVRPEWRKARLSARPR